MNDNRISDGADENRNPDKAQQDIENRRESDETPNDDSHSEEAEEDKDDRRYVQTTNDDRNSDNAEEVPHRSNQRVKRFAFLFALFPPLFQ